MSLSRASRRTGRGTNVGALNPKVTVSTHEPNAPKDLDIWIDISSTPTVLKIWDSSTVTWGYSITSA